MALKSRASVTSFKSLPLILSRNLIYKNPEPIFPHRAFPSVHFSPLPGELYEVFGLPSGNFVQPYHTGFLTAGVCALTLPKISEVLTGNTNVQPAQLAHIACSLGSHRVDQDPCLSCTIHSTSESWLGST